MDGRSELVAAIRGREARLAALGRDVIERAGGGWPAGADWPRPMDDDWFATAPAEALATRLVALEETERFLDLLIWTLWPAPVVELLRPIGDLVAGLRGAIVAERPDGRVLIRLGGDDGRSREVEVAAADVRRLPPTVLAGWERSAAG